MHIRRYILLLGVIELGGVANRSAAGKLISDRSTHTDGGAVSTNRALAPGILPELNNSFHTQKCQMNSPVCHIPFE